MPIADNCLIFHLQHSILPLKASNATNYLCFSYPYFNQLFEPFKSFKVLFCYFHYHYALCCLIYIKTHLIGAKVFSF